VNGVNWNRRRTHVPLLTLMLRFSLMRANKVVVKCTFMSLSRGMFILISFLYANRFGHFPPKPSGGSMFFSISYISEYNILPLQSGKTLAKKLILVCRKNVRCVWIVFCPYSHKLVQVMGTQDGRVSRQIVKVVHDDSDEQVQHLKE
jgi:hypothetical protein